MISPIITSIIAVFILAAIHPICALISKRHVRRRTTSLCAGIALAYLFLHLLPELSEFQQELIEGLQETRERLWFREHLWVTALVGLLVFQFVDTVAKSQIQSRSRVTAYRLEILIFATYSALIGYAITTNAELDRPILLVTVALAAHFFGTDLDLAERYEERFVRRGSYALAGATLFGMLTALVFELGERALMYGFAFLGGGILINTLRTELPEPENTRAGYLLVGTVLYAALMLGIYFVTR